MRKPTKTLRVEEKLQPGDAFYREQVRGLWAGRRIRALIAIIAVWLFLLYHLDALGDIGRVMICGLGCILAFGIWRAFKNPYGP